MFVDEEQEEFTIDLPEGYIHVTQISKGFVPSKDHKLDTVRADTKFTVTSLEQLKVVVGPKITFKTTISPPVRVSAMYNYLRRQDPRGVMNMAMAQLWQRLECFEERLPDNERSEIMDNCCLFFDDARSRGVALHHEAVWFSVTCVLVKRENYQDQILAHRQAVAQTNVSSDISLCSVCSQEIETGERHTEMACGDKCHDKCLWTWPAQEIPLNLPRP